MTVKSPLFSPAIFQGLIYFISVTVNNPRHSGTVYENEGREYD
jgi:hypothetical protein